MTTVYFIRHAQSDNSVHDGRIRPLTEKGLKDRALVTDFLNDKQIDVVLSSPFKRAIDTVADFADEKNLSLLLMEDFREHNTISDSYTDNDYFPFIKKYWDDFHFKTSGDESLFDVQERNIAALNKVLTEYKNKNIVIGTHGMALSTIISYFDYTYGFENFLAMVKIKPWVVKMDFNDDRCVGMETIDLFNHERKPDYEKCKVHIANLGALKAYRYTVTFARYKDKWLYCRAKSRDTFETAGGRVELGESPLEAAKREFYEETGVIKYDITPAFDYSVHVQTGYSNGQVFFAQIQEIGDMPDFEMAEVKLFDTIPDRMRFPQILPVLYEKMQMWLNLQSATDEVWDVYDHERHFTGRTHRRIDPMSVGDYHLVVHVWLLNNKGEFLITKRAPNKGYPNMWECTGGSAIAGDDSITAAVREVKEETGLDVYPENGSCVFTLTRDDSICDVWLFKQNFDIKNVILQESETTDAKYATTDEISRMIENGEFIDFHYIEELFEKANELL